jgi:hypothetical protein
MGIPENRRGAENRLSRWLHIQQERRPHRQITVPKSYPMPAVSVIARALQNVTRSAARRQPARVDEVALRMQAQAAHPRLRRTDQSRPSSMRMTTMIRMVPRRPTPP